MITIQNPEQISADEKSQLLEAIQADNFAVYDIGTGLDEHQSKRWVAHMAETFGLRRVDRHLCADDDGITPLAVSEQAAKAFYIPYTDRAIQWHTDGYYNTPQHTIRAFVLHCVQPAAQGGENQLINPDAVYARLSAQSAEYIHQLSQPEVMTIPANVVAGKEIRPAQSSPVFSHDVTGQLLMRYTDRKRNIIWQQEAAQAVAALKEVLSNKDLITRITLQAGQGVLCNNVLHSRSAFENSEDIKRVMLRARYYDRVHT